MPEFRKASMELCCPPVDLAVQASAAVSSRKSACGLLIINADDWGGWPTATDAARAVFEKGRLTSVSAMVFMEDSERAAALAKEIGLDVGLHVNSNQAFSGKNCPPRLAELQARTRRFLRRNKYALLCYHPFLRDAFRTVYQAQLDEFHRLYGRAPSHIDGHQHMHLCSNMLIDGIISAGQRVRRSFSFWPGEKSWFNRSYRRWVDGRLTRRYILTDYMFALSQCLDGRMARVTELARTSAVELMTHPEKPAEYNWLMSNAAGAALQELTLGTFPMLLKGNRELRVEG